MLHLIERLLDRILPPPVHRLALRIAHKARYRWRGFAKPHLFGVSVILRNDEGHVLLVRHSYGPDVWSLPGGGMEKGEAAETAARREMREELNIELSEAKQIGTLDETLSGTSHTAHILTARTGDAIMPDGREIAEARFFPANELPQDLGTIARRRIDFYGRR